MAGQRENEGRNSAGAWCLFGGMSLSLIVLPSLLRSPLPLLWTTTTLRRWLLQTPLA